jgi:hypothetical protein
MTRRLAFVSTILLGATLSLYLTACNAPIAEEPVRGQVEVTPANPSPIPDEPEEMVVLDLCSLLTEEEVAKVLTVEVTASDEMGFANCSYTSADPTLPYSVSVSSAQGRGSITPGICGRC